MIENVEKFLCSPKICIDKIQYWINEYSHSESVDNIGNIDIAQLLGRTIVTNFFSYYFDKNGLIYFPDEIDPKKITEFILNNKEYNQLNFNNVYIYVCRIQMKKINSFYSELNNYEKNGRITYVMGNNHKCNKKEYEKRFKERAYQPHKRLAGKAKPTKSID